MADEKAVATDHAEVDLFKPEFKYFKSRKPPPDFSKVIDFDDPDSLKRNHDQVIPVHIEDIPGDSVACLLPVSKWKVYHIKDKPGFTFIVDPFRRGCQRYWVHRCLHDYPGKPNKRNIDAHIELADVDNIWKLSQERSEKGDILEKLRWVTLGYQYDWTNKKYYCDEVNTFPEDLSSLCRYIATATGFADYRAEAAIVNFYHQNSTLAGHTDHSELHHTAPLISISFGQPAIFLLGGKTKSEKPLAMFIRSGDVVIMAESSRLCYHAVPRILSGDPLLAMEMCESSTETENVIEGKAMCRIAVDDETIKRERNIKTEESAETAAIKSCKRKACDMSDSMAPSHNVRRNIILDSVRETGDSRESESKDIVDDCSTNLNENEGKTFFGDDCPNSRNQDEKGSHSVDNLRIKRLNSLMEDMLYKIDWEAYDKYLKSSRINMNVRQVFISGQSSDHLLCKYSNKD